jgi:hypothetical protein
LPLHTKLSDEDVEYVIETFKDVVWEYVYGKTAARFVG